MVTHGPQNKFSELGLDVGGSSALVSLIALGFLSVVILAMIFRYILLYRRSAPAFIEGLYSHHLRQMKYVGHLSALTGLLGSLFSIKRIFFVTGLTGSGLEKYVSYFQYSVMPLCFAVINVMLCVVGMLIINAKAIRSIGVNRN